MARKRSNPGNLKAGDVIGGKYRVERLLGEGGMGMVVAAHHVMLDQPVAVKLLYSDDEEAVSRLIIEAKSCARIPGEHVSRVLDIDRGPDGLPFIVMELLEGVDLYQVLASQGPQPRWLVVDYVLQALMGLAGAHARGIVHRDLKPSNLFLATRPDGSSIIKVLDFGVSKSVMATEVDQSLTGAKAMLGSPPYMSPEQVRSPKTVDHRADIWAMGILMYELLTGRLPFRGQEIQETFAMILEREVPRLRDLAPEVPEGMEAAILKCLTKARDDRFQNVSDLAKALVPYGSGTWTHAADEIRKTLARPFPEDTNPSRSRSGMALASNREVDVQPTASTVIGKRKFQLSNETSRSPMLIAGVVILAAALFVVAAFIRVRMRNAEMEAAAEDPVQIVPMQVVPPTSAVAVPGVATALPGVQTGVVGGVSIELADDAGVHAPVASGQAGAAARPSPQVAAATVQAPSGPSRKWKPSPAPAPQKPVKPAGGLPSELLGQE